MNLRMGASALPAPLVAGRMPRGWDDTSVIHWHASPELAQCAEAMHARLDGPRWESIEVMARWMAGMGPTCEERMWGSALAAACLAEWRVAKCRDTTWEIEKERRHFFLHGVIPWLVQRIESGKVTEKRGAAEAHVRGLMMRDLALHPDPRVRALTRSADAHRAARVERFA